jgi:serine/threonine protein phosphatase PrpC
LKILNKHH